MTLARSACGLRAAFRGLEIGGEKFRDLGLSTARAGSVCAPCRFRRVERQSILARSVWTRYRWTRHIAASMEAWRPHAPPRYAAIPILAVTDFRRGLVGVGFGRSDHLTGLPQGSRSDHG